MTTPFMPNYTPATLATHALLNQLIDGIAAQEATIATLAQEVAQLREELGDAFAAAPAAAPAAAAPVAVAVASSVPAGWTEEKIGIIAISKGVDEKKGGYTYKAIGVDPRFSQYGVRVWEEVLPRLGLDGEKLKFGPNPFSATVKIAINPEGKAQKVIGLAN